MTGIQSTGSVCFQLLFSLHCFLVNLGFFFKQSLAQNVQGCFEREGEAGPHPGLGVGSCGPLERQPLKFPEGSGRGRAEGTGLGDEPKTQG